MNCFYFHFIVSSKVHEFHPRKRHGLTAPTGYLMVEGSHKMICGNATNSAMMRICANTCGITPKKISDSGRPMYRATTKAFSTTGGEIGRASCRERVCTSGEFQVGSVTLKK